MIMSIDTKYDKLNSELRNLMSKNKDQSLKSLLAEWNDINIIIRETKEGLKQLRAKAETDINYKDVSYLEPSNSYI